MSSMVIVTLNTPHSTAAVTFVEQGALKLSPHFEGVLGIKTYLLGMSLLQQDAPDRERPPQSVTRRIYGIPAFGFIR